MDNLDKQYKQKQFFSEIYRNELVPGGKLRAGQYIRVFQPKDDYSKISFFNDVDDLVKFTSRSKDLNTYFTLSTTDGSAGTNENLLSRTALGFDFDKKDLGEDFSHKELLERFKALNIWYHILVNSGHGYHAYMLIDTTEDLRKVDEVQQALCKLLGADLNAIKSTQILRVPCTLNTKNTDDIKPVSVIKQFDRDTIKRYTIENLHNRFCRNVAKDSEDRATKFVVTNTNIPGCVKAILENGTTEGDRYNDLQKVVVALRNRNKSLAEIQAIMREWAQKSDYSDNLGYRVQNVYENLKYVSMDCNSCSNHKECFSAIQSEFEFKEDYEIMTFNETNMSKLAKPKRKGAKVMEANSLVIFGILQNHNDGLFRREIEKELTYKKKCRFSKNTLTEAMQDLEENGFIEVKQVGKEKLYALKKDRAKAEQQFRVSFWATSEVIKGRISAEELRLYTYMRYLHNKEQRENPEALKGNLFQINQRELAEHMGVTQGRISVMINNLLDEMLLSIWYRQPSRNNGFDYYVYRLNA